MIKIPVQYMNGQKGLVNADDLELLIRARKIASFRRSSGWVRVAFDPIREGNDNSYFGAERRNSRLYGCIVHLRLMCCRIDRIKSKYSRNRLMNRLRYAFR